MNTLRRDLQTAIVALRRNLLRSLLTVLGIVIGTASVITMVEIGQGSSNEIKKTIASMGANNLLVLPGTAASGGVSFGAGSAMTLTAEDAEALRKGAPALRNVAPIVRIRGQVIAQGRNWVPMFIYGTTPEFFEVRDWRDLSAGTLFSEQDVRSGSRVCVIGETVRKMLFEDRDPLNQIIRVQNVSLTVIGVLSRKGANMMGMDQDDIVVAPWTTVKFRLSSQTIGSSGQGQGSPTTVTTAVPTGISLYPTTAFSLYPPSNEVSVRFANIDQITTAARSEGSILDALEQITSVLRERHKLACEEPDDFNIRHMTEMTEAVSATTRVMTRLLLVVACISLLVGGVGIMNIMLVSVVERTREIGLRLAVGAAPADILRRFLTEAIVLCLSGGLLGILLGRGASTLVSSLLNWPTSPSLTAILTSVGVSTAVGLLFGFYPAYRASNLDPVEALRHD